MLGRELLSALDRTNFLTAPSGRRLGASPSLNGIIMEFNDGAVRRVLIGNAALRASRSWGATGNTTLADYTANEHFSIYANCTDAWLNSLLADKSSSTANTSALLNYSAAAAARYCRSLSLNGAPASMPNINVVMRMFADREIIDSLDATLASYPGFALGRWSFPGAQQNFIWSSTEYSDRYAWCVTSGGACYGSTTKTESHGVVPVLDMA